METVVTYTERQKEAHEKLASDLAAHIKMEEKRDHDRDILFTELRSNVREITREIRPNGGSSIKDMVNSIAGKVEQNSFRIEIVERQLHGDRDKR